MADFRLRIGFAKTGAAIWLSHLEVVRSMERCLRRSGLPCAISQGFSPHLKHSFSTALPVGTGSIGELMDVDLSQLVDVEQALEALQAAQHECLPILSAEYAPHGEPSLQVELNHSVYCIELDDPDSAVAPELIKRLLARPEITITKKGKPRTYELSKYIVDAKTGGRSYCLNNKTVGPSPCLKNKTKGPSPCLKNKTVGPSPCLILDLLSRPEGSLRPEVILEAVASPDIVLQVTAITRIALKHQDL